MAEEVPSTFVDPRTGEIRRLGTFWDKAVGDWVPKGLDYALTAAKAALMFPVAGVAAVIVPAGLLVAERLGLSGAINHVLQRTLDRQERSGALYDFSNPADKRDFEYNFGDLQPQFADDFLKMVKLAGLKQMPKIYVSDQVYTGGSTEYNAGAMSFSDGGHPAIQIGMGVMESMTPGELRAIIGHEIGHIALGHTKDRASWLASKTVNRVMNIGLGVAAVFGLVPVVPALALIGASWFAGKALKSINARHREELCDRASAILTGGTQDLANGLRKLEDISTKMLKSEAGWIASMTGRKVQDILRKPGWLTRFLKYDHPSNERRARLLDDFEHKYGAFCERQRAQFKTAFNTAAARRKPAAHAPSLGSIFAGHSGAKIKKLPGGLIILSGPKGGLNYAL